MDEQSCLYLEINIEPENGSVFIHSEQVPGLHLIGPSFQQMKSTVETAIKRLFRDNEKLDVNLIWLKDRTGADIARIQRVAVCPLQVRVA
jgi:hypothetical protein